MAPQRVFISHSREDKAVLQELLNQMKASRYDESPLEAWHDIDRQDSIESGEDWMQRLKAEIEACQVFCIFLTANWAKSNNCRDELTWAEEVSKRIVQIQVRETAIPRPKASRVPNGSAWIGADMSEGSRGRRDELWRDVVEEIQRIGGNAHVVASLPLQSSAPQSEEDQLTLDDDARQRAEERHSAPATPDAEKTPVIPSEPEPVLLGVSAPKAVKPNTAFIARFATYIKAVEGELERMLTALGGGKMDVVLGIPTDKPARWLAGTPVTVLVSGDSFVAQPSHSRFVWNGTQNVVSFVIKSDSTLAEGSSILCFEVYIEGIRVAFVPIQIDITAQPTNVEQRVKANPARTAFASYASLDRERVMDKLGALSAYDKVLEVFTDCLEMRPGESWKERLEVEIPNSDLFLLFWSRAASASQWVSWEWHTALERKGLGAIQPMPLEAPQFAPPPPELSSLHFNDIYLIVREAELARQSPH